MEKAEKNKPKNILTLKLKGEEIQITRKEMNKWSNNNTDSLEISLDFLDIEEFQYLRNIWENKDKEQMMSLVDSLTVEQLLLNLRASVLLVLEYDYILEELFKKEKAGIVMKTLRELNIQNGDLFMKMYLIITERLRKGERGEMVAQWLDIRSIKREMFAPNSKEELHMGLALNEEEKAEEERTEIVRLAKRIVSEYSFESLNIGINSYSDLCILMEDGLLELNKLSIIYYPKEEEISIERIEAIGNRLPFLNIKDLDFSSAPKIYEKGGLIALSRGIANSKSLRILSIYLDESDECGNLITDGILESGQIESLTLCTRAQKVKLDFLERLRRASSLKSLKFCKYQIYEIIDYFDFQEQGIYLSNLLAGNNNLQNLTFSYCKLNDETCTNMANGLKQGNSLNTLIMPSHDSSCKRKEMYQEKGVIQIIEALHYCPKLLKLEFSYFFNQLIYEKLCHHFVSYSQPVPEIKGLRVGQAAANSFYDKLFSMIFERRKNNPECFSKYYYLSVVQERKVRDYELIFPLGEGAFGKTYLVRNGNNFYAMKEVLVEDQNALREAEWEGKILKFLDHPNIVKYIDAFIINNNYYIVMELAMDSLVTHTKLISREKAVRENWKTIQESLKYLREIAEGTSSIHASDIVHLDLKPPNIFIHHSRSILIGDFGLSNRIEEGSKYLTTDQGTVPYIAPEIWKGQPFKFEPDVFAYGVIFYQLLTGQRPFTTTDDYGEIICKGEYDDIPLDNLNLKPNIIQQVKELVKRCLIVERKERANMWDVLGMINRIYGAATMPRSLSKIKVLELHTQPNMANKYIARFEYIKLLNEWILFESEEEKIENNSIFMKQFSHSLPFTVSGGHYTNADNYYELISNAGGLFLDKYLELGHADTNKRNIVSPEQIIRWLLEILPSIKYLHDNNIYYHNLSINNLLVDTNNKILLGPGNFPFSTFYEDIVDGNSNILKLTENHQRRKVKRIREFPALSQDIVDHEILGIYEFCYELCTGSVYTGENNQFNMIEERYGSELKTYLLEVLTGNQLEIHTLKGLYDILHSELKSVLKKKNLGSEEAQIVPKNIEEEVKVMVNIVEAKREEKVEDIDYITGKSLPNNMVAVVEKAKKEEKVKDIDYITGKSLPNNMVAVVEKAKKEEKVEDIDSNHNEDTITGKSLPNVNVQRKEMIISRPIKIQIEKEEEKEVENDLEFSRQSNSGLFKQTTDEWMVINGNLLPVDDNYITYVPEKKFRGLNDPQNIPSTNQKNNKSCLIF